MAVKIIKSILISLLLVPLFVFAQSQAALPSAGLTPESPFYFLDKLGETLQDFFTFNPENKARLQITFAAERFAEIKLILETRGIKANGLAVAQSRLQNNLAKAAGIVTEQKIKGLDVSGLAKELDENLNSAKSVLIQSFKDQKRVLKAKEEDLKTQLKVVRQSGETIKEESLTQEFRAIEAQRELLGLKREELEGGVETAEEKLGEALETKFRAEKAISKIEKKRTELLDEAKEEGVELSEKSLLDLDKLLSEARKKSEAGDFANIRQSAEEVKQSLDNLEQVIEASIQQREFNEELEISARRTGERREDQNRDDAVLPSRREAAERSLAPTPPSQLLRPPAAPAAPPSMTQEPTSVFQSLRPTVDLKVNDADASIAIAYETSAILSWRAYNAAACAASGNWSGAKSLSGVQSTGDLTSSKTYILTCSGDGGTASDRVTVNVLTRQTPPAAPEPEAIIPPPASPPLAPTVDIKANNSNGPLTIVSGTNIIVSWVSTNAISCTGSGNLVASALSGNFGPAPTGNRIYTITCTGAGGTASDSVTVNVSAPPPGPGQQPPPPPAATQPDYYVSLPAISPVAPVAGNKISFSAKINNRGSNLGLGSSVTRLRIDAGADGTWDIVPANAFTDFILTNGSRDVSWTEAWTVTQGNHKYEICADFGSMIMESDETNNCVSANFSAAAAPPAAAPTVDIKANNSNGPLTIVSGTNVTVSWVSANAISCIGSGNLVTSSLSGSLVFTPAGNRIYTITCTGAGGTASDSVTVNVSAPPPPPTVDIKANNSDGPISIASGSAITLSWTSSNAISCTASGGWSGSKSTSGSESTSLASNVIIETYTISCIGAGGTASDSMTVNLARPDLVVPDLSLSPWPVTSGSSVGVRADIKNQGTLAAANISSARVRIDIGNDGTWDIVSANKSVSALLVGSSETKYWYGVWTATAIGTNGSVEVCADGNSEISESDESNNCSRIVFTVR